MKNCAIVGINWGDEGKGRMVDLLTEDYDVVIRYQGGGNAGHTVVNDYGKFSLHLLPSGIFHPGVVNVLKGRRRQPQKPEDQRPGLPAAALAPAARRAGRGAPGLPEIRLDEAGHRALLFGQIPEEDRPCRRTLLSTASEGASQGTAGVEKPDPDRRLRCRTLFHGAAALLG